MGMLAEWLPSGSNARLITWVLVFLFAAPPALRGQAMGPRLAAESLTVVGSDARTPLSSVSHALFDGQSRLYVLDFADLNIVRHSGTGFRSTTTLGRSGAGPGEFRSFAQAGWKADTLWVFDDQLQRTSFFVNDRLARTEQFNPPPVVGLTAVEPLSMAGEVESLGMARYPRGAKDERSERGYLLYRLDNRSRRLATVRWLSRRNSELSLPVLFRGVSALVQAQQPLTDDPFLALRPRGGVVVVERHQVTAQGMARVQVTVYRPDGSQSGTHGISLGHRPLTPAVRRDVARLLCVPPGADEDRPQCTDGEVAKALYLPRNVPAATAITACDDGGFWLRLAEWPRTAPVRFVRLGSNARPTGWLELPPTTKVLACSGDRIATTLSSGRELLLPIVIRRVPGPGR